ncbi:BRO-N domain-containing protein [Providencia rettgeri]|uniref:BRO family, N-terminal domain n=1 Tax=Providencia rettgeri TaxID=587 RepID=A0A9N8D1K2_PRORE|nr:BRO family protein [Providencia rettgeri]CAB5644586.1 BRO family, N-terminal domain [Providencia rettgeri]CAB5710056.1 BRO family, N-terminal domain [Providencia rettgeri]CAC9185338.1 BRO family, N-terminal domain [Providencia rettgeri]CAC9227935.1 BRO family, N-terminal domain [Providencia rettgeri]
MNIVAKTDLTFQSFTFNPIVEDDQVWLTSTEIAHVLGYSRTDNVSKLYARNADEFTDSMTMTVNMTFNGINNSLRNKSVRVYSLRGAHLIAMFSNTPVAKQFRKWVLDILDREVELGNHSPVFNYHYPIESADVHNRKFDNAWLTPSSLIDNRNPAPELDLIEQLERDGFDVTGAKVRIHALHNSAKQAVQIEELFVDTKKMLHRLKDSFDAGSKLGGANVVFEGKDKGVMISGNKKRNIGCH